MSDKDPPPKSDRQYFVAHEVTEENRQRVRTLAKVGTQEEVAGELGFSVDTLQRYYLDDYIGGNRSAAIAVKSKLLAAAMGGSVNAMAKFLTLIGAGAPQRHEFSGPGGRPIEMVDLSRLSPAQLEQYGRLAAIAEGLDPDAIIVEHLGTR